LKNEGLTSNDKLQGGVNRGELDVNLDMNLPE